VKLREKKSITTIYYTMPPLGFLVLGKEQDRAWYYRRLVAYGE
jgi:hypothetical protein